MRANFYAIGSSITAPANVGGLNSLIQLGLIRLNGAQSLDQMTEIVGAMIRSLPSGEIDETTLDYKLESGAEDYNEETGAEDFGTTAINYVNHQLRIIATNDGRTAFLIVIPDEVGVNPGARYYSCSIKGVWHVIEIAAVDPGESYRVNTLELTVVDAGRLL